MKAVILLALAEAMAAAGRMCVADRRLQSIPTGCCRLQRPTIRTGMVAGSSPGALLEAQIADHRRCMASPPAQLAPDAVEAFRACRIEADLRGGYEVFAISLESPCRGASAPGDYMALRQGISAMPAIRLN